MASDYRHSQTERRRDDRDARDARDRVRGPKNGSSSAAVAPKPLVERSRTWENHNNHGTVTAPIRDRPSSEHGPNARGLFAERVAPRPTPDTKSAPRPATAPRPDDGDVQVKLRKKCIVEYKLRDLYANRANVNKERAAAQSNLAKLSRPGTDFPQSVVNHYRAQQKKCEEELNHIDGQIREKEARHFSLHRELFQAYVVPGPPSGMGSPSRDIHAKEADLAVRMAAQEESLKKALLDHKSVMDQHLSSTLNQYKSQMEALACRAQRDLQTMADKYEERISELNLSLKKESEKNSLLQTQLLTHGQMLQELDLARSQPPGNCALAEKSASHLLRLKDSQDERMGALDARMNGLDSAVSQVRQTTEAFAALESAVKKTAEDVQKLTQEVASGRTYISNLPMDELRCLPAEFTKLQKTVHDRLDHQNGRPSPASPGRPVQSQSPAASSRDTQVLPPWMVQKFDHAIADLDRCKQGLVDGVNSIGPWVTSEREARTTMGARLESQLSELRADVEAMKAEQGRLAEETGTLAARIDADISHQGERLESVNTQIKNLFVEFKSESCMIHTSLQSLEGWQANFNTKNLYRDIVTHIISVTSDSVPKSLANLSSRLSSIERQLKASPETVKRRWDSVDEDPSKRRRIGEASMNLSTA